MPPVFSSVKEAWNSVLSGAVPMTNGRVSCSTIDASNSTIGSGSNLSQAETQATIVNGRSAANSNENEEGKSFECCNALVRLADDEDNSRKEIDIDTLTDDDLRRLKKDDPFLYYSIPSIRRRSYLFDDDDGVRAAATSTVGIHDPRRRRESVVKRNRRLSTEVHPSLVFDEILRQFQ